MRLAIFWDITQRVVVISYRRFGITYPSHLEESNSRVKIVALEDETNRLSRNVGKELPLYDA
jgi:hypothetical protein